MNWLRTAKLVHFWHWQRRTIDWLLFLTLFVAAVVMGIVTAMWWVF
jgi:hypothetical protein